MLSRSRAHAAGDCVNQRRQKQVVDDFSSKIGLPGGLETPESIDANHMQMANARADQMKAIAPLLAC